MIQIGKTIEAKLQEKNLKQKVVAESLNINPRTFSTYVNDTYFPPLDKLADICKKLDIDLNHILELEHTGNTDLLISGKAEAKICGMLRDCNKQETEFLVSSMEVVYHHIKKYRNKK
ncbi:MAG: helix-turn-helix transcriptional regulator [Bacilli bacterium]